MHLIRSVALPVIFLVGILTIIWWKDHRKPARSENPAAQARPMNGVGSHRESRGTEGRWLVEEVARDIAEMVCFAVDPKADPEKAMEFSIITSADGVTHDLYAKSPRGEVTHTLKIEHHVWAPEDHAAWAEAVLKAWQPSKTVTNSADGAALTRNLTDLTTERLVKEERRLSGLMNKQPLDPELHEEAAVILGAFALRENAGNNFTDLRPALCRMTAHLALARALRREPGIRGQLAAAIQLAVEARQVEALERIAKLPVGLEPWVTALKLRSTGDWRMCADPAKATLLEQICWARAIADGVNATPLQVFLETCKPQDVPDWHRAVFVRGFSVEHGHVFARDSIRKEFTDIATSWKTWSGEDMKADNLVTLLNDPARRAVVKSQNGGGAEVAVLGWGQIAAQHQRHLLNALYFTDYFLRDQWGVPEEAAKFEAQITSRLSGLRLYPFLVRCFMCIDYGRMIPDEAFAKAMREAVEICKQQPQLVSTANWCLLTENAHRAMPALPPPQGAWFTPSLPVGTGFDFEHRINDLHLPLGGPDAIGKALGITPYDVDLILTHMQFSPGELPSPDREREALKNVSAFNLRAMRHIANQVKSDPKAYAQALRPACALDPDLYVDLGNALLQCGLQQEAAAAYLAGFEKASDRVCVSNNSEWLVNYLYDHGRKDEAVKVAEHAGEVYSHLGLETAGHLAERMEEWDKAAAYYMAIAERYGSVGPFQAFLMRNKDRDPKLAGILQEMMSQMFPDGLKKAALADFNGKEAPAKGVVITSDSHLTRQFGLKSGDILVALDGCRVEDFGQYDFIRALQPDTVPLQVILWDGASYREISALLPDRRFQCDMAPYER